MKDKLREYINNNLQTSFGSLRECKMRMAYDFDAFNALKEGSINTYIDENKNDNKFQKLLFKYIDERNLKDSDVYNKVNMDRRLFSKIRNQEDYHPSKETIILLGIALELNENEIEGLLDSASYSLPYNNTYDLIIRFCFKEGIYNINTINEFLYDYNLKTLQ